MNKLILGKLKENFSNIGDDMISGNSANLIVDKIVKDYTIPDYVIEAKKYIEYCNRDMGFIGSPEYTRQRKIVDDYYKPIRESEEEMKEWTMYLKLKSKYEKN